MTGQQKIRLAGIGLIVVSLANICLLMAFAPQSNLVPKVIRFAFTCILSACLMRGASWARWLVVALNILAAAVTVIGVVGLTTIGSGHWILSGWMALMALFYGWVACLLIFDQNVNRFFNPSDKF